jgi:hypothetical protein
MTGKAGINGQMGVPLGDGVAAREEWRAAARVATEPFGIGLLRARCASPHPALDDAPTTPQPSLP